MWLFTPADTGRYLETTGQIAITVNKATPTGPPGYTTVTAGGKTLADVSLTAHESWPAGTVAWKLPADTAVQANTAYEWVFTPADSDNYNTPEASPPYAVSTGGSSGGGGDGSSSPSVSVPASLDHGGAKLSASGIAKTDEAEDTGLTVRLPDGAVELDEAALESIASGKNVTVSVQQAKLTDAQ